MNCKSVDGVFFFTPEYNRSVPAALKKCLGCRFTSLWSKQLGGKPALVVSVSPGAIAGFGANHHLRQSLVFLDMPTLQQPEAYIGGIMNLIDENNTIKEDTVNFFKQSLTTTSTCLTVTTKNRSRFCNSQIRNAHSLIYPIRETSECAFFAGWFNVNSE